MVELSKKDWEDCKNQAEAMVKQGMIMKIVNENLLEIAEKELKGFPDESKEIKNSKV